MANGEVALLVDRHAVGTRAARHLNEYADLAGGSVLHQRNAPDRVVARHREKDDVLGRVEDEPIGTWNVIKNAVELAVRPQPVQSAGRILQPGLSLVGEIQVAVRGEQEIIRALETLQRRAIEIGFDFSGARIQHHDAVLVVGDEGAPVLVELETVRLAVVFRRDRHHTARRDLEDAAPGNIDHPKVAVAIERGTFQECRSRCSVHLNVDPNGGAARG